MILLVLDLIHVSNGLIDVDSNQLTTPEITVTEIGKRLRLRFRIQMRIEDTFQLDVYILNELYHRLPDRLYSTEVATYTERPQFLQVGCFHHHL